MAKKLLTKRGVELVDLCIQQLKIGKNSRKAKPVSVTTIQKLRLRGGKKLPPTLAHFFQYDLTFDTLHSQYNFIQGRHGFGISSKKPLVKSLTLQEVALGWLKEFDKPFSKISFIDSRGKVVKNPLDLCSSKLRGDFYPLPYMGEQQHFLYVGKADDRGEYPIVGAEWDMGETEDGRREGEFFPFFKYPSFDVYLADMVGILQTPDALPLQEYSEFKFEFKKLLRLNPGLRT